METTTKAKNDGFSLDQKKFAVFCLVRVGCEIIDTNMKFVDKTSTEVLFTDKLTLCVTENFLRQKFVESLL